ELRATVGDFNTTDAVIENDNIADARHCNNLRVVPIDFDQTRGRILSGCVQAYPKEQNQFHRRGAEKLLCASAVKIPVGGLQKTHSASTVKAISSVSILSAPYATVKTAM